MRRTLTLLGFALAVAVSGLAFAPNDTIKVDGGVISGTAASMFGGATF